MIQEITQALPVLNCAFALTSIQPPASWPGGDCDSPSLTLYPTIIVSCPPRLQAATPSFTLLITPVSAVCLVGGLLSLFFSLHLFISSLFFQSKSKVSSLLTTAVV